MKYSVLSKMQKGEVIFDGKGSLWMKVEDYSPFRFEGNLVCIESSSSEHTGDIIHFSKLVTEWDEE